jgi:hypothetical protein
LGKNQWGIDKVSELFLKTWKWPILVWQVSAEYGYPISIRGVSVSDTWVFGSIHVSEVLIAVSWVILCLFSLLSCFKTRPCYGDFIVLASGYGKVQINVVLFVWYVCKITVRFLCNCIMLLFPPFWMLYRSER